MSMKSVIAALLIAGTAHFAIAQDKKADAAAKEEKFESKKSDRKPSCCRASFVNFNKELGVPLEYLNTIGSRIATARKTPDPVDLALAAQALAAAEAASGKKASVTSAEVYAEALDLVKQRNISTELAAFAVVAPDQATKQAMTKAAVAAKNLEDEEKKKAKRGEGAREILGTLYVTNNSDECVKIYVDGRYVGTAHAGETTGFRVHTHSHNTQLVAICEEGGEVVSRAHAHGHNHDVSWTIN